MWEIPLVFSGVSFCSTVKTKFLPLLQLLFLSSGFILPFADTEWSVGLLLLLLLPASHCWPKGGGGEGVKFIFLEQRALIFLSLCGDQSESVLGLWTEHCDDWWEAESLSELMWSPEQVLQRGSVKSGFVEKLEFSWLLVTFRLVSNLSPLVCLTDSWEADVERCKPRVRTDEVLVGGSWLGGLGLGCHRGSRFSLKPDLGVGAKRVNEPDSAGNLRWKWETHYYLHIMLHCSSMTSLCSCVKEKIKT